MKLRQYGWAGLLALAVLASGRANAQNGGPTIATDDAYSMAVYYTARGYNVLPSIEGMDGAGAKIEFLIPVSKGIDYVFLAGRDKFVQDLDIFVLDENNGLILEDRRGNAAGGSRAGVKFRSAYSGTVKVILHVASVKGGTLGAWSVIVGRRGGGESLPPVQQGDKIPDGQTGTGTVDVG